VPFLDHPLVEFLATVPADVKFKSGKMKQLMKAAYADTIPKPVLERRDKMGFPVPLKEWFGGPLKDFVTSVFTEQKAHGRPHIHSDVVLMNLDRGAPFSRKIWGLMSLELWTQRFHDRASEFRKLAA
jgi:asparagine synthase (glutamine-hydrolysing)